jgi:hypothetical protein
MPDQVRVARTPADDATAWDQSAAVEAGEERERIAGFLASGTALLATTARVRDILAPERGEVVPISVRSDGVWVWSDAHAYYAEHHGVAPEPDFYAHIRAQGYRCRRLTAPEAERALEAFYAATG